MSDTIRTKSKTIDGTDTQDVHATIKNLTPKTTYRYWLVAKNADEKVEGDARHFTTTEE